MIKKTVIALTLVAIFWYLYQVIYVKVKYRIFKKKYRHLISN